MWVFIVIAIVVGTMVPLQAGVNSQLAKYLSSPIQAAFISFLGGVLVMIIFCYLLGKGLPSVARVVQAPSYLLIGGLLGGVMVITSIIMAPKLGATVLVSSYITGQLVASILLDHYGLLGFPHHPMSLLRLLGVVFLVIGLAFVRNF